MKNCKTHEKKRIPSTSSKHIFLMINNLFCIKTVEEPLRANKLYLGWDGSYTSRYLAISLLIRLSGENTWFSGEVIRIDGGVQ